DREAAAALQKAQIQSVATWAISRNDVPASAEACDALIAYCREHNVDMSFTGLNHAFGALVNSAAITPDYSKAARDNHERFAETLRSRGYNIQAIETDASKLTTEELKQRIEQDARPFMTNQEFVYGRPDP